MRSAGHRARDLVQVELHGFGVGVGHGQARACAAGRTNGSEQVSALVALVGRLSRPRSAAGPLPYETVLLADAGLVLEPDLDGLAPRKVGEVGPQRGGEVFLNSATIRSS